MFLGPLEGILSPRIHFQFDLGPQQPIIFSPQIALNTARINWITIKVVMGSLYLTNLVNQAI